MNGYSLGNLTRLSLAFFLVLFLRESLHCQRIATIVQDGPVSVNLGDVYRKGEIRIEPYDLTTLPPLPAGYAPINNKGYGITTTALASGPFTVHFSVASVTEEETFKDLRIFHAEPDTFDPDSPRWVDRTSGLAEGGQSSVLLEAPAPNFSNEVISAVTEELGVFVIGRLIQKIPPSDAIADLLVTCQGSPETVTAPNKVTFTVTITNKGPQRANDVGAFNDWSPGATLISATPSQGTCKESGGYGSNFAKQLGDLRRKARSVVYTEREPERKTWKSKERVPAYGWVAARLAKASGPRLAGELGVQCKMKLRDGGNLS